MDRWVVIVASLAILSLLGWIASKGVLAHRATSPPVGFRAWWNHFRARHEGKKDGQANIPANDATTYPPALLQIKARAEEAIAKLNRLWANDDATVGRSIGSTRQALQSAQEDMTIASNDLVDANKHKQQLKAHWVEVAETAPENAGVRLEPLVYYAALALVLIAEFPLNALAFQIFGENKSLTYVITGALAIILVACAHGLGVFLRVPHPSSVERRWKIVLVVLPFLVLIGIAVVRTRYLGEAKATALSPLVSSLVFLVINTLIYTGTTMLSYLAHAPDLPGKREEQEELKDVSAEQRSAKQRSKDAAERQRSHHEALAHADVALEESERVHRAREIEVAAYYRVLMTEYCTANLRARGGGPAPTIFGELPPIEGGLDGLGARHVPSDPVAPVVALNPDSAAS